MALASAEREDGRQVHEIRADRRFRDNVATGGDDQIVAGVLRAQIRAGQWGRGGR
ncbi:MAG: hypothetical protein GY820_35895 [Gammaproteobacteria bacterium]|nr:hypothetical protein [Gammaproteobacteria bacterium]